MTTPEAARELLEVLGTEIDAELLVLALTHRSFANEAGGLPTNERLEFLGDSVLSIVVTEHLYRTYPDKSEGDLAKIRAASVSQDALAALARGLGLGAYILLGKGERAAGGRHKESILSDTLEAVFGAVYLSHGLEVTRELIIGLITSTIERAAQLGVGTDYKTGVQELASALGVAAPRYEVAGHGPDHARHYTATLIFDDRPWASGSGPSKKRAEQQAAQESYEQILAAYPELGHA